MVNVELCDYNGWEECVKISNDKIEVIAATKIGPRIIHFAFRGKKNIFYESTEQMGLTEGEDWRIYGGHRLWHGPQIGSRPNESDNIPISFELLEDGVILTGNREKNSGMQKQITIRIPDEEAIVSVSHSITNQSVWPVELTAWALSVMTPGGVCVWPYSKQDTGYLPNNVLVTWPYTNLQDSRFYIQQNYMSLRQNSMCKEWFKAGTCNTEGWAAYLHNQTVFLKKFEHIAGATYSDFGSSFEIYTDEDILEIESLSPLTKLNPGDTIHHKETWQLISYKNEQKDNVWQKDQAEELFLKICKAVENKEL